MSELGSWLRAAREAKNLSLAEVEATLRIRQKFLAAMEAEQWDALPGEVATLGFLRKYAAYLGLDPQEAVNRYRRSVPDAAPPIPLPTPPPERPAEYQPIDLALQEAPPRRLPWRAILTGLLLLGLAAGGWWAWTQRDTWRQGWDALLSQLLTLGSGSAISAGPTPTPTRIVLRVTATPTATSAARPTPAQPPAAIETPTPEPTATAPAETAEQTPSAPAASVLLLELITTERSWVSVVVDDQKVLETTLEAGQSGRWEGQQSIAVRTGNAAGVQLTLNGEPVGPLGSRGQVVALRWELSDGAVVVTTPTPLPTRTPTPTPAPSG
ncbi:MAG: DUF4115 domain-containing protein [Caldilineales bacterium]|nr:DUF4115 domain-containing protein [Caldilineales bacterium]MDW8316405.1 DUF4115 domain-containing protein [Anaerolineae bacterium]